MRHYFAKTEREDILLGFIDELHQDMCDQYNNLSPADCGVSSGEIDDGLSQLHNRIIKALEAKDE